MRTTILLLLTLVFILPIVAQTDAESKILLIEKQAAEAMAQSDFISAIKHYEEALLQRQSKFSDQELSEDIKALKEVAKALDKLITAHFEAGNIEKRLELSTQHLEWLQAGMEVDETDSQIKLDHIFSSLRVIESHESLGDLTTALRLSNNLIASLENETNKSYKVAIDETLPLAYSRRGDILKGRADTTLSIKDHEKSLSLYDARYEETGIDSYLKDVGLQSHILVQRYAPLKDTTNALKYAIKAADAYGMYIEENPDDQAIIEKYILSCNGAAGYLTDLGNLEDGTSFFKESWKYNDKIYTETGDPDRGLQVAAISTKLWINLRKLNYLRQGVKYLERRVAILTEIQERLPSNDYSSYLTRDQFNLAKAYQEIGDLKASLDWVDQSIQTGSSSVEKDPASATVRQYMIVREHQRYEILRELGEYDQAYSSLEKVNGIFSALQKIETEEDYSEEIKDIKITQTELAYPDLVKLDDRISRVENKETKATLQNKLLKLIKKKLKKNEELIPSFVKHTNKKAWDGLFINNFKSSEKEIKKAMKFNTGDPYLITNLAPSLLFQGKYEEAEEVYMNNYSKPFRPGEIILDGFLADFDEFLAENVVPAEHKSKVISLKNRLEGLRK